MQRLIAGNATSPCCSSSLTYQPLAGGLANSVNQSMQPSCCALVSRIAALLDRRALGVVYGEVGVSSALMIARAAISQKLARMSAEEDRLAGIGSFVTVEPRFRIP
jgi:hypothetical protein